jgi:hypothetical protein
MRFVFEGTLEEMNALLALPKAAPVSMPRPAVVVRPSTQTIEEEKEEALVARHDEKVAAPVEEFTPAPVEKKKGGRSKKVAPAPEPVVDEETYGTPMHECLPEQVPSDGPEPEDKPTIDDVLSAADSLIKNKGIPAARALIGTFGVSALPDLPEKLWMQFIKKAMEAGA